MTYVPSTPRVLEAIRRHGSATIGELADELGMSVDSVRADLGGLHDHGRVTRYGSRRDSLAYWNGPDDAYVLSCLATVEASIRAAQGDVSSFAAPPDKETR